MELKRTYFNNELATNDYLKELNPKNIVVTRQNVLYNQETGEECYSEITEYMNGSVKLEISMSATSIKELFSLLNNTEEIVFTSFDGTGITNAECLFCKSSALRKIDMYNVSMPDLENMSSFAICCYKLEEISFPKTGNKLTNIQGLIDYCYSLRKVDLSGLNASNIENMVGAFDNIGDQDNYLEILDLSMFNLEFNYDVLRTRLSFKRSYIKEIKMPKYIPSNCVLLLARCYSKVLDFSKTEFASNYIEKNKNKYWENIEPTILPETKILVREEQAKIVERIVYGRP